MCQVMSNLQIRLNLCKSRGLRANRLLKKFHCNLTKCGYLCLATGSAFRQVTVRGVYLGFNHLVMYFLG